MTGGHRRRCFRAPLLLLLLLLIGCGTAIGGDFNAGESKSGLCVACHGKKGVSKSPDYPSLACQQEAYLAKTMRDYRNGARQSAEMAAAMSTLSDADVDNLATYYASFRCRVRKPAVEEGDDDATRRD